jgi:hypothetical protein
MHAAYSVPRIRLHLFRCHGIARRRDKGGSGDGGGGQREGGRRMGRGVLSAMMRFRRDVAFVLGLSFVRRHVCIVCLLLLCFSVCSFDWTELS